MKRAVVRAVAARPVLTFALVFAIFPFVVPY